MELVGALGEQIAARSRRAPLIDDPLWTQCEHRDRCVEEISARLGTQEVLLVRLLATPNLIRLTADRFSRAKARPERLEAELPRDRSGWARSLRPLATRLVPEVAALPPAPVLPPPHPEARTPWLGWIAIGAGVALGGVGLGFGLSNRSLSQEIDSGRAFTDAAYRPLADKRMEHGVIADLAFGLAAAAVIGGAIVFLAE
jgi:hypothetical protein